MTIYTPNYMQGATYTAKIDRWNGYAEAYDEGVLDLGSFAVSQRAAGPNISVDVALGDAIVTGDDQALQGNYRVKSDAVVNVTLTAVPGTNSRYDIIILQINDPDAGGPAGNNAVLTKVTGTAAASPTVPATPNSALLLATIGPISASTTSITSSMIVSNRLLAGRRTFAGAMELSSNQVPNGWLLCNGLAISRTTYARLFQSIGTLYGVGNGTTTFNVPDLRDRVPVQVGTVYPTYGATGGEFTHTLTTAELPAHSHVADPPSTALSITDPGHNHGGTSGDPFVMSRAAGSAGGGGTNVGQVNASNTASATSGISGTVDIAAFNTANTGGGAAHNVMQPFQVIGGWLIRT